MKKKNIFSFFLSFFFLSSCFLKNEFEESIDLKNSWNYNSPAIYNFKINDDKQKIINIIVRNNNDYEFNNLYFFVHHIDPAGKKNIDTLQYFLADSKGKWLGSGYSSIKQNLLELKALKSYSMGNHTIKIFHGMRRKELKGIEDLALVIN